jgi:hypothetical protein
MGLRTLLRISMYSSLCLLLAQMGGLVHLTEQGELMTFMLFESSWVTVCVHDFQFAQAINIINQRGKSVPE